MQPARHDFSVVCGDTVDLAFRLWAIVNGARTPLVVGDSEIFVLNLGSIAAVTNAGAMPLAIERTDAGTTLRYRLSVAQTQNVKLGKSTPWTLVRIPEAGIRRTYLTGLVTGLATPSAGSGNTALDVAVYDGGISVDVTVDDLAVRNAIAHTNTEVTAALATAAQDAASKAGAARTGAVSDVRGGVATARNTLAALSDAMDTNATAATSAANAARSGAVSDVRGGVATARNTLAALSDAIDTNATAASVATTAAAGAARTGAVSDVRGGVATARNTLAALSDAIDTNATAATSAANAARSGAVSDVRGGVATARNTLATLSDAIDTAAAAATVAAAAARTGAASDVRGGVATARNTLAALSDAIDATATAASVATTAAAGAARSGAVSDVRGGVATARNTLAALSDAIDTNATAASVAATAAAGAARTGAVSDVRGGVATARNTLAALSDAIDATATAASVTTTAAAGAARSGAVSDVRGGVDSAGDTLAKLLATIAANAASTAAHATSTNNPHSVTKAQVGLSNVVNLAPDDMPVSAAAASAITAAVNGLITAVTMPGRKSTVGDVAAKLIAGTAQTFAFQGDSILYGQDTQSASTLPAANGSGFTRSVRPIPEQFAAGMAVLYPGLVTVQNWAFPGEQSSQGLAHWANSGPIDCVFVMYGHNDANAYGGGSPASVAAYRANMRAIIELRLSQGSAVVLLLPPHVQDTAGDSKLRAYVAALASLGREYGLQVVDLAQVLRSIDTGAYWIDGVHLTAAAYNEIGRQLPALFAGGGYEVPHVSPGLSLAPSSHLGRGEIIYNNPSSRSGFVAAIPSGGKLSIPVVVDAECYPVLHLINLGGTSYQTIASYAGGYDKPNVAITVDNGAGYPLRTTAPLWKLSPGLRLFQISNSSTAEIYIESISFVARAQATRSLQGNWTPSALVGMKCPQTIGSGTWWSAVDYGRKLIVNQPAGVACTISATLRLGDGHDCGLLFVSSLDQSDTLTVDGTCFMVFRENADLVVRQRYNGFNDLRVSGVFPASGDWTGDVDVVNDGANLKVHIDGTLKATYASPAAALLSGYPGIFSQGKSRLACYALQIQD